MGRVGSDNWLLKSGRVQTLVGRVGSEKLDPGTTLLEHVHAYVNNLNLDVYNYVT